LPTTPTAIVVKRGWANKKTLAHPPRPNDYPILLTAVTNPLGHSIHLTYDRRDNVLTFTDANGQVTRRQYDGNGNLTRQINALNQETRYEYEGENRLIRVIDAKNQVTQLGYDAKGRLISLINPLGYTQRWNMMRRIIYSNALTH